MDLFCKCMLSETIKLLLCMYVINFRIKDVCIIINKRINLHVLRSLDISMAKNKLFIWCMLVLFFVEG